jgi:hypothetical protein
MCLGVLIKIFTSRFLRLSASSQQVLGKWRKVFSFSFPYFIGYRFRNGATLLALKAGLMWRRYVGRSMNVFVHISTPQAARYFVS